MVGLRDQGLGTLHDVEVPSKLIMRWAFAVEGNVWMYTHVLNALPFFGVLGRRLSPAPSKVRLI
jgi:hypothetical protein